MRQRWEQAVLKEGFAGTDRPARNGHRGVPATAFLGPQVPRTGATDKGVQKNKEKKRACLCFLA